MRVAQVVADNTDAVGSGREAVAQFTSRLIVSSEVGEGFADGEASPDRLRVVLTLPGTPADEVRLHLACAEHRLRGEWYEVAAVDVEATMDADLDLLCISLYCAADASLLVVKLGPLLVAVALLAGAEAMDRTRSPCPTSAGSNSRLRRANSSRSASSTRT